MKLKREAWLDISKAYAIILVVIGHVVGGYTGNYSNEAYDKFVSITLFLIYSFHMPLFFFLSGYSYAIQENSDDRKSYVRFLKKKARRLLIPYVVFTSLQVLIKLPFQGKISSVVSWKSIPLMILIPVDQFWYLYVLFVVSALVAFIDWKNKSKLLNLCVIVFAYVSGALLSIVMPGVVKENSSVLLNVMKYSLFFYCGAIFKRKKKRLSISQSVYCFLAFVFISSISQWIKNEIISYFVIMTIMAFVGIGFVVGISMNIKAMWKSRNLLLIGRETMSIYIFHVLICAVIRILLFRIGITNFWFGITVGNIASIYLPILIVYIWRKLYQTATSYIV